MIFFSKDGTDFIAPVRARVTSSAGSKTSPAMRARENSLPSAEAILDFILMSSPAPKMMFLTVLWYFLPVSKVSLERGML